MMPAADGPAFVDIAARCHGCGMPFIINAGEVQFYARKRLNLPGRCPRCRADRQRARDQHIADERRRAIREYARDHRCSERDAEAQLFGDGED